jgi:hypothetical protein
MIDIAWDSETFPIAAGAVAPRMVCASAARWDGPHVVTDLVSDGDDLRGAIEALLLAAVNGEARLITHNGGFDYSVVYATWPDLVTLVFEALESGNCVDTLWGEKLLNLSTTGRLDHLYLPDGSSSKIEYGLADLERTYLGRDRSAEKHDESSWRANYAMLSGVPAAEYPEDAARYARQDAEGTLLVWQGQQVALRERTHASQRSCSFQLLKSFCLYLETAWGMEVDPEAVADMRRQVDRVLAENRDLLVASGALYPGRGRQPHKKHLERAGKLLRDLGLYSADYEDEFFDWEPHVEQLSELGIRFKAAQPEKSVEAALQRVAAAAYRRAGVEPTMTAGRTLKDGTVKQGIKLGDEETEFLAGVCPIMAQYHRRKSLRKLATNQIPILESGPVIHFKYNALVETTRTSSYGNRKGREALFPAANGQQVPKAIECDDLRVDPRRAYRPRAGTVFFDVDLHCLELACVGQVTHDLFGHSVHLERYNAGYDLHAYLGSQILTRINAQGASLEMQQELHRWSTAEEQYQVFVAFKKCGDPALEKVYKDTRSLAKPIGLGFPGGIGPAKMVTLAWGTYGVRLEEDQARDLREVWRDVYPEMPRYFDWVTSQRDFHNVGRTGDDGRTEDLYWYETPMGVIRRGCTYCSIANGKAMQSPGAEAATAGNNAVVRACHDPSVGSILLGGRPIAFVHDQVIGETTRDPAIWHDQAMEVSRLMIEAARTALPLVKMRTEPLLTVVWSKAAEPVFGEDGRLIPWTPEM